jgi:hypothetical protein
MNLYEFLLAFANAHPFLTALAMLVSLWIIVALVRGIVYLVRGPPKNWRNDEW